MFLFCLRFYTLSYFISLTWKRKIAETKAQATWNGTTETFLLVSVEPRNCIYFREFENLGREREVERIGPGKSKTQVRTVNSFTPIGLFFPVRHLPESIKTCAFNYPWNGLFADNCERPSISSMTLTSCVRQVLLLAHLWAVIQGCSLNRSLEFEKRTTGLVKGCYCHNDSLSLCFEIRQDLIQLTDKKSNILVRYGKLAPQRFHVQVLGDNFLW